MFEISRTHVFLFDFSEDSFRQIYLFCKSFSFSRDAWASPDIALRGHRFAQPQRLSLACSRTGLVFAIEMPSECRGE
jgi:hypothetical protein